MKKYLKLIGIFLIIVGGLVLVMNLDTIKQSLTGGGTEGDTSSITKQGDEIRKAWAAVHGWDEALYKKQYNGIEQRNKSGLYRTQKEHIDMLATLQAASTSSIYDAYMSDILPGNYSDIALRSDYEGVEYLLKKTDYASNAKLKDVKDIHALYTDIYRFTRNGSHPLSVKLDTTASGVSWKSFSKRKDEVLSLAAKYRNNKNYGKLKSIKGFSEGLSDSYLHDVLDCQNTKFYKDLSDAIIAHYAAKTPTEDLVKQLNDALNRYADAYSLDVPSTDGSKSLSELEYFYSNYKKKSESVNPGFDDPRLKKFVK